MDETDTDQAQVETPKAKRTASRVAKHDSRPSTSEDVKTESKTLVQRLIDVLAEMPAIGKNSKAPANMGGYNFRSIEDITAAVKPLFGQCGVIVVPMMRERRDSERAVSGNKTMFVVDLLIDWRFIGADGDELVVPMWGTGTDMGDKAVQKAVTASLKSALTPTLMIGDGFDPEAVSVADTEHGQRRQNTNPPPPPPADPAQWWVENGWLDQNDHDAKRKVINDTVASMPEQAKTVFKGWCEKHEPPVNFHKAWPAPLVEEMRTYLKQLADLYRPAPQPPAPQPPAPQPPPEAKAPPGGDGVCTWCAKPVSATVAVPGQTEGNYHPACADEELAEMANSEQSPVA